MFQKMKELEQTLSADKGLATKYQEALANAAAAGAQSDSQAICMAAAAVGVQLTPEEVEREFAESQPLDKNDLEEVAGGANPYARDEYGHEAGCWTLWHCYTVTLHTQTTADYVWCWSDYTCTWSNN